MKKKPLREAMRIRSFDDARWFAWRVAHDVGMKNMAAAGRDVWAQADSDAAVAGFYAFMAQMGFEMTGRDRHAPAAVDNRGTSRRRRPRRSRPLLSAET